jgi:23S rRNA (adenine2503-C2)-methyltransferase
MWAVTLLAGVNDGPDDARSLAELVARFRDATGRSPRLSIIPYNAIGRAGQAEDPFTRTSEDRERSFRDALRAAGVFSHKRYSGGSDVAAACGQLAARA